jgi:hypothetical protein
MKETVFNRIGLDTRATRHGYPVMGAFTRGGTTVFTPVLTIYPPPAPVATGTPVTDGNGNQLTLNGQPLQVGVPVTIPPLTPPVYGTVATTATPVATTPKPVTKPVTSTTAKKPWSTTKKVAVGGGAAAGLGALLLAARAFIRKGS